MVIKSMFYLKGSEIMIIEDFVRKAKIVRVVDGDTIDVIVDMGFRRYSEERLRINRINAPEIRGISKFDGQISKEFVESLLPIGTEIFIQSFKGDAFGRWLAEVYFIKDDVQINLSDLMLELGYAVLY
jgi:micrococcal nuclease